MTVVDDDGSDEGSVVSFRLSAPQQKRVSDILQRLGIVGQRGEKSRLYRQIFQRGLDTFLYTEQSPELLPKDDVIEVYRQAFSLWRRALTEELDWGYRPYSLAGTERPPSAKLPSINAALRDFKLAYAEAVDPDSFLQDQLDQLRLEQLESEERFYEKAAPHLSEQKRAAFREAQREGRSPREAIMDRGKR